ncbi:hypothetical protein HDK90DRAFT_251527 [Phyllosticta capitalensis]|uniref:Secreted protein n=1 Tax=Phyllosticta capitalensis TaxID=121624 RepID=A0ABR1YQ87_9PEZI
MMRVRMCFLYGPLGGVSVGNTWALRPSETIFWPYETGEARVRIEFENKTFMLRFGIHQCRWRRGLLRTCARVLSLVLSRVCALAEQAALSHSVATFCELFDVAVCS